MLKVLKLKTELPQFYKTAIRNDTYRLPLIKPYELFSTYRGLKEPCLIDTSDRKSSWLGRQICDIAKFDIFNNFLIAEVLLCRNVITGLLDDIEVNNKNSGYIIWDMTQTKLPELKIERDYAFGRINYFGKKIKTCTNPPYYIYISFGKDVKEEKFLEYDAFMKRAEHFGFDKKGLLDNFNKIQISIPEEYQNCLFFDKDDFIRGLKKYSLSGKIKLFKPEYFYDEFINTGYCHWFPGVKKMAGNMLAR